MAEPLSPTEKWVALFTLVTEIIISVGATVYIVLSILATNKITTDDPEVPDNIVRRRAELDEARRHYEQARRLVENYFRPTGIDPPIAVLAEPMVFPDGSVGPRGRAAAIADPLDAGPDIYPEAPLKAYLDHWETELRQRYGVTTYGKWLAESPGRPALTFRALFETLQQQHTAREEEVARRRSAAEQAWQNVTGENGLIARIRQAERAKLDQIRRPQTGLRDRLDQVLRQAHATTSQLWSQLEQLQQNLRVARLERSQFEHERAAQEERLRDQLAQLEEKIRHQQHLRARAEERQEPDGRVLAVDEPMRIAYLDFTHADRLFPGMRFRVVRVEPGAVRVLKGEVEVFEIGDTMTRAAIVHTDPGAPPIREGDLVFNIYYERGRPTTFTFAGRFTRRYSQEDLIAALRQLHDRTEPRVTERTDVVVCGDGFRDDPNFRRARELGIRTITENALIEYLNLPR